MMEINAVELYGPSFLVRRSNHSFIFLLEHSNQKVDGKEVQKALDGPDMARSLKARGYCGICLCLCVWC